jgi:hypothetical protein
MYKEMYTRTWEPYRGPERKRKREIAMLETRSMVETGLRRLNEIVSYCQENQEAGKTDIGRWLCGSRIKHSTQSVGDPAVSPRTENRRTSRIGKNVEVDGRESDGS